MNKVLSYFSMIFLPLCSSLVFAGGPLIIEGSSGNTPVTYEDPNIALHVESGDLGVFTNDEADIILQQALKLWNTINTSTINLIFNDTDTRIAVDINIDNYFDYIPRSIDDPPNSVDGLNPVIYDDKGEIIDAFFYTGASEDIAGFAASSYFPIAATFSEGFAVINGKDSGRSNLTDTQFMLLIAHEIGHLFGLDHSQTNINNQETIDNFSPTPFICTTDIPENYPIMYPFVCRDVESLHADEVSAVSALYPMSDVNNYFGILQGNFVDESGYAVLGANIWAENITTGEAISIVSDYLKQGTGFYKLYLPPGNYTLHANSINTLFDDGSSVGPYATSQFDTSFIDPHPIPEVTYQGATQGNPAVISITSNQTLNVVFSITGNDAVLVNPPADSSGSSGTSYITLLLLLSFLLMARYADRLNRYRKRIVSTTKVGY